MRVPNGDADQPPDNVHPKDVKSVLLAYVDGVLAGRAKNRSSAGCKPSTTQKDRRRCLKRLLEVSTCPDFIEDKGHYYGHDLSDEDKRALVEYMKYF